MSQVFQFGMHFLSTRVFVGHDVLFALESEHSKAQAMRRFSDGPHSHQGLCCLLTSRDVRGVGVL